MSRHFFLWQSVVGFDQRPFTELSHTPSNTGVDKLLGIDWQVGKRLINQMLVDLPDRVIVINCGITQKP